MWSWDHISLACGQHPGRQNQESEDRMHWLKLLRKLTYLKRDFSCCVLTWEGQPSHGWVKIYPGRNGQSLRQCLYYSLTEEHGAPLTCLVRKLAWCPRGGVLEVPELDSGVWPVRYVHVFLLSTVHEVVIWLRSRCYWLFFPNYDTIVCLCWQRFIESKNARYLFSIFLKLELSS